VPIASIVAASYGWQAVFVMAVGLNATAALLALFVIKPMRRAFILGNETAPPDANGDAESKLAAMEATGIRVSASPARLGKTLIDVQKG
jgi:predicted MFS family arabinose efflux permease